MSKHHPDLIMCRKQTGIAIGRIATESGKSTPPFVLPHAELTSVSLSSPICDSYVRPAELVRICDECNFGTYGGRCIICGGHACELTSDCGGGRAGISDAYYCAECVRLEKSRDGCVKIINIGASRSDAFYTRKAAGQFVKG
ncbi:SPOSA6832_02861, partial [Sporobolomyces salmonicolor]